MRANARFWTTVAPATHNELTNWRRRATTISDPSLRSLALGKLQEEHFNAQVAATLATLAPLRHRGHATSAIVAYEVLYDYLDGLTERRSADHLKRNQSLYRALTDAVILDMPAGYDYAGSEDADDGGYLDALCWTVRSNLSRLPRVVAVLEPLAATARRCAESQARVHAANADSKELLAWAARQSQESPLGAREWLAGAVASVLGAHALIGAATQPATTSRAASDLADAYLAVCALSTMLDGLVDQQADEARGERSWLLDLFSDEDELAAALLYTARQASSQLQRVPQRSHHLMTMTGVVAYYTSSPSARQPHAARIIDRLHSGLGPKLAPTLGIMRAWRLAKHVCSAAKNTELPLE